MSKSENTCTREEFFEWLNSCPSDYEIANDYFGNTTVKFRYKEKPMEEGEGEDGRS